MEAKDLAHGASGNCLGFLVAFAGIVIVCELYAVVRVALRLVVLVTVAGIHTLSPGASELPSKSVAIVLVLLDH